MSRFELFKNLMVMAASDGKITEEELQLLSEQSSKWGLTDEQFGAAIQYAQAADSKLSIPSTNEEGSEMLRESIRMMAVDGDLADIEKKLFAVAAARLGISNEELDKMIDDLLGL